ncbi:MAG TPA: signal recognition particle-docking protein FtsY, partial [Acidiferrobacteraceae bacterium]|nr:signal recognition particle-docking protein FtsY [Acidiferrobacteraceae bacterium]HEX19361.1 signal recognition particle-docking protein FtsY [Acidiferrobacteraceae bacterium]
RITNELERKQLSDGNAIYSAIQRHMLEILQPSEAPLQISADHKPTVILAVGVNGVGKTTTVGKLTLKLESDGHKVMLAAADTFRAAAIEQLQAWGERNKVPVIAQHSGADAAAVAHDAYQAAQARGLDVLIVDTAGRQHTHDDLMQELSKIKRVLQKLEPSAPHEVLLVLDANTGQNALAQYEHFNNTVGITGLCLTKMDGTAKGGILLALAQKSALPIRYIGVGEGIEDLRTFQAREFIDALLPQD